MTKEVAFDFRENGNVRHSPLLANGEIQRFWSVLGCEYRQPSNGSLSCVVSDYAPDRIAIKYGKGDRQDSDIAVVYSAIVPFGGRLQKRVGATKLQGTKQHTTAGRNVWDDPRRVRAVKLNLYLQRRSAFRETSLAAVSRTQRQSSFAD